MKKIMLGIFLLNEKNNFKGSWLKHPFLNWLPVVLFFFSCHQKYEKTKPVEASMTEAVYASGIIKAKNQYQVFSTVNGVISKIFATENDLVKKGSPIIAVSDKASAINSENALLTAQYSEVNANQDKLHDLQNDIDLARSKYENDSMIYKRQQNLWNENIGTRIELEQKQLAFKNALNVFKSTKIKYDDLLRQLKYNERQSRNNLAISQSKVGDLTIRSEIDGKIYSLPKEVGEMVSPQTSLALIGDASSFLMELQVDEYDIVKISLGQKVLVIMDSYKGKAFEGRITKIDPLMNDRTKSFSVEAEFIKQPEVLYPNLTVEANIIIQTKQKALLIPRNYLVNDSIVLVEKDKKRVVITGLKDYKQVEILKGLTTDDVIYKPEE